jgi:hypothetical protein
MIRYIAFDCESGGTTPDRSLLTVYFEILDGKLEQLASLDLKIKPNDDVYSVTAEALGVNKIDLVKHDAEAIYEKKAGTLLYEFLKLHSQNGQLKLTPLGHGVHFDIKFVTAHLVAPKTWETFVSYRTRDTGVLGGSMIDAGIIPRTVSGSLKSFCEWYQIKNSEEHTSVGDVGATIALYKKMLLDLA